MNMIPKVFYTRTQPGLYEAFGRPSVAVVNDIDREAILEELLALPVGAMPPHALRPSGLTTGLSDPSATFTNRFPSSPDSVIDITAPGTYRNIRYWGRVRVIASGVVFDNCQFHGPKPSAAGGLRGCIQNYGSTPPHFEVRNSLFDPGAWVRERGEPKLTGRVVGLHGGNVTMRFCEITNCSDGINHLGPSSTVDLATAHHTEIEYNWFHKGYYENNFYPPDDGQPHCDGFQFNTGKNVTIRFNLIGGLRDATGYITWPGGYNSGDDWWNSCIMFQQEAGMSATQLIENVLIEKNWFIGGTTSLNHSWISTRPNTWPTTTVRDNWIYQRQPTWGYKMRGDALDTPGYRRDTSVVGGYYVLKHDNIESSYSNNRVWMPDGSDGGLAPISRG